MVPEALRLTAGRRALRVRAAWCKGCGICLPSCPAGILALDENERIYVTDISHCIFCGVCAARCPDFVFTLERTPAPTGEGSQ